MTENAASQRSVILTFDDGPEPVEDLQAVVAALDTENIKGCFFLLGEGVERHPEAVRALAEGGHEVGNHNWRHVEMPTLPDDEILAQLRRTQEAIHAACGVWPRRCRVPFGAGWYHEKHPGLVRASQALDLEMVNWSLDTNDWMRPFGIRFEKVRSRWAELQAEGRTARADILMHVHAETAAGLPELIAFFRGKGYGFGSY